MAKTPKKIKYVVETSAIRPAIGHSTPAHCGSFQAAVADGELYTSFYIRMEFLRRWICSAAKIAFATAHYGSLDHALHYLEQDFSQRENKSIIAAIAAYLRNIGPLSGSMAAEEIASLAIRWLDLFDATFSHKTNNSCRCKIGVMNIDKNYNSIADGLNVWYIAFNKPVTDCHVGAFLQIGNSNGRAEQLSSDATIQDLTAVKNLATYHNSGTAITCTQCKRIGDAVIALEQAPSFNLVHTDSSFCKLCPTLRRANTLIPSVRSFDKDLQEKLSGKDPA